LDQAQFTEAGRGAKATQRQKGEAKANKMMLMMMMMMIPRTEWINGWILLLTY